jgi:DNA-binding NarL/FixJ family response regulator
MQGVTPAERRILETLADDGPTNAQIAQRLHLSPYTVKWQLFQLMERSGTHTRTALALWWIRTGRYSTGPMDIGGGRVQPRDLAA